MIRHQPVSTLFPYTTLFRSNHEVGRRAVARDGDVPDDAHAQQRLHIGIVRLRLERIPKENEKVDLTLDDLRADLLVAAEDRKSTRLNSSHVAISYAVFCLKK